MDLRRIAERLGTTALATGVLLAIGATAWDRWALWRMLVDADPRLADLPVHALLLGTGRAVIEVQARSGASVFGASGLTMFVSIPPIWRSAVPFVIAGACQVIGGLVARKLAARSGARALGALFGCAALGLLVALPFSEPAAIVPWLGWVCPASTLTLVVWALAAGLLALRDRRRPDRAPT